MTDQALQDRAVELANENAALFALAADGKGVENG